MQSLPSPVPRVPSRVPQTPQALLADVRHLAQYAPARVSLIQLCSTAVRARRPVLVKLGLFSGCRVSPTSRIFVHHLRLVSMPCRVVVVMMPSSPITPLSSFLSLPIAQAIQIRAISVPYLPAKLLHQHHALSPAGVQEHRSRTPQPRASLAHRAIEHTPPHSPQSSHPTHPMPAGCHCQETRARAMEGREGSGRYLRGKLSCVRTALSTLGLRGAPPCPPRCPPAPPP